VSGKKEVGRVEDQKRTEEGMRREGSNMETRLQKYLPSDKPLEKSGHEREYIGEEVQFNAVVEREGEEMGAL